MVSKMTTMSIFWRTCQKYGDDLTNIGTTLQDPYFPRHKQTTFSGLITFQQKSLDYVLGFILNSVPLGAFDPADVLRASVYLQLASPT